MFQADFKGVAVRKRVSCMRSSMSAKVAGNIIEVQEKHVLTGLFFQAFLQHFNHFHQSHVV
jgi:hypothetical protein